MDELAFTMEMLEQDILFEMSPATKAAAYGSAKARAAIAPAMRIQNNRVLKAERIEDGNRAFKNENKDQQRIAQLRFKKMATSVGKMASGHEFNKNDQAELTAAKRRVRQHRGYEYDNDALWGSSREMQRH